MDTKYKLAPVAFRTEARRSVDWKKVSDEDLKFALDVLSLHESPYEVDCANEIERRINLGLWPYLVTSPPSVNNVPIWLKIWPFCLLWRQRGR